jgi:hypothetical protein
MLISVKWLWSGRWGLSKERKHSSEIESKTQRLSEQLLPSSGILQYLRSSHCCAFEGASSAIWQGSKVSKNIPASIFSVVLKHVYSILVSYTKYSRNTFCWRWIKDWCTKLRTALKFSDWLTFWLNDSMQQSPSWEANSCSASQEIHRILCNP